MQTKDEIQKLSEETKRLRDEIGKKTGKSPEELYEEREKRVREAIQLKEPDRVPVTLGLAYFPGRYAGVPASAAYYDHAAWRGAYRRTLMDFEPDLWRGTPGASSGTVMEALDTQTSRWPGFNLPAASSHQAIELETMKEDEYDHFLNDPSDFVLRRQLPRSYGALEPLSKLPPLRNFTGAAFTGLTPMFATPEFVKLAEILHQVGQETAKNRRELSFEDEAAALGFPIQGHAGGVGGAPFDTISDFYRGMRGAMTDMFRCPDKLLAALDKLLQWRLERATPADPKKRGNPKRLFIALHRGAEGFMSKKQFETFYWPGLKAALLKNIELGYVPMPFLEGKYESRLEYFLELPKGSTVLHLDLTDMIKAKEIVGDHLCIMGNVPSPLLQVGSVSEVEEYCEKLIKVCGKGGGFILTNGSSIDEAKPANVKAMVDSVKKFRVG